MEEDFGVALGGRVFLKGAESGDGGEDEEEAFVGGDPHDEHERGDEGAFLLGEGAEGVAAVELEDGEEVEEVHPGAEAGDRREDGRAGAKKDEPGSDGGAESPDGAGETHAGVFVRTGGVLFHADEGAEAGDEHGGGGGYAIAAKHPDVAHFVNVNGEDNAEGEFPSPDAPVEAEGEEHGKEGAGFGEAEEEEFCFGECEDEDEFEFPEEEADDPERSGGAGPFRFGSGLRGMRSGIDLADELIGFLADGCVLGGVRREELQGATPGVEGFGQRSGGGGSFGFSGDCFEFVAVNESVAGGADEEALRDFRAALGAGHLPGIKFGAWAMRAERCRRRRGRRLGSELACSYSRLGGGRRK